MYFCIFLIIVSIEVVMCFWFGFLLVRQEMVLCIIIGGLVGLMMVSVLFLWVLLIFLMVFEVVQVNLLRLVWVLGLIDFEVRLVMILVQLIVCMLDIVEMMGIVVWLVQEIILMFILILLVCWCKLIGGMQSGLMVVGVRLIIIMFSLLSLCEFLVWIQVEVVLKVIWILFLRMQGSRLLILVVVVFSFMLWVWVRFLDLGLILIIYIGLRSGLCCILQIRLVLILFDLIRVYLIFFMFFFVGFCFRGRLFCCVG